MFCEYTSESWAALGSMLAGLGQLGLVLIGYLGVYTWRASIKLQHQLVVQNKIIDLLSELNSSILNIEMDLSICDETVISDLINKLQAIEKLEYESWIFEMKVDNLLREYQRKVALFLKEGIRSQSDQTFDESNSKRILSTELSNLTDEIVFRMRVETWVFTGTSVFSKIMYRMLRSSTVYTR
jgi:hypothetical protein